MRLCRYRFRETEAIGFYDEQRILSLPALAVVYETTTGKSARLPDDHQLLDFLPPDGHGFEAAQTLFAWIAEAPATALADVAVATAEAELLVPVPRPNKLLLLAGNYAEHIQEGGGIAAERQETFPYVFMKPPTTTLTDPCDPVRIPAVSPDHIDWELELAVIIGRRTKGIAEADALSVVAGYTVINDISDRKFRPNPNRKEREKDKFFDWLHGKWHDSFCPCGPCVLSANALPNPQSLPMKLSVGGQVFQDGSTGQQIFPVAAVIAFIASFVTLEPGDIISTGTPAGVGNTTGTYLKAGDTVEASIDQIGTLVTRIE